MLETTNQVSPLELMRIKAEAKAKQMAILELRAWNDIHEHELLTFHGFTKKTLAQRKKDLIKTANS